MSGINSSIPRNRETAYGYRISVALDTIESAYREIALKKQGTLCSASAEQLDCALAVLQEFFPTLDRPDAYASSDRLIPALNMFYRSLIQHEDSVVRQHMQAYVRARLYAGNVRNRVSELTTDPSLVSISVQDNLPLALALGENRSFVASGQDQGPFVTYTRGLASETPMGLIESGGRPFSGMEKVLINRHSAMRKADKLLRSFGPLVVRSPWARSVNRGNVSLSYRKSTDTDVNVKQYKREMPAGSFYTNDQILRWLTASTEGGYGIAQGDNEAVHDPSVMSCGQYIATRYRGNATLTTAPEQVAHVQMNGVEEIHGSYISAKTRNGAFADFNIKVAINGDEDDADVSRAAGQSGEKTLLGVKFTYIVMESKNVNVSIVNWTVSNIPAGELVLEFKTQGFDPDPAYYHGDILMVSPPLDTRDDVTLNDDERLEMIRDHDFARLMVDFFQLRDELTDGGVSERWYLRSYHSYILGATPAYTRNRELTDVEVTSIKAAMLNPAVWSRFKNLSGFLEKVYDDVGSMVALIQSTEFE